VEYALMASLIAVVIVAAVTLFGRNVSQLFYVPAGVL
jgi:Flp pilus assembly pilin Flp